MTLSKASLGEARELYETRQVDGPADAWRVSVMRMADAARFVERLLPEECQHGYAVAHWRTDGRNGFDMTLDEKCEGQVWDGGLEAVVASVLKAYVYHPTNEKARAVLSALTAEVGK